MSFNLIVLLVLSLAVLFANKPILFGLLDIWRDAATYSHAPLIVLLVIWLVWRQRFIISQASIRWNMLPFLALLFVALMGVAAEYIGLQMAGQLVWLITFLLLPFYLFGFSVGRNLLFPIGFLIFSLPVWNLLVALLQTWTVMVVSKLLDWSDIPALIKGNYVTIATGEFVIAEGCSGLRYFLVALALTAFQGYLAIKSFSARLWMVVFGIGLALIANWLRVFGVIIIGHYSNMQSHIVEDHSFFGWVVFALVFMPFLWVSARRTNTASDSTIDTSYTNRDVLVSSANEPRYKHVFFICLLLMAILLINPLFRLWQSPGGSIGNVGWIIAPTVTAPWEGPDFTTPPWRPGYKNSSAKRELSYTKDGQEVFLHILIYPYQLQGAELISEDNRLSSSEVWQETQSIGIQQLDVPKRVLNINEVILSDRSNNKMLVWFWYDIGGSHVTGRGVAKLYQLKGIFGDRKDASLITLSVLCEWDCEKQRLLLEEFTGIVHSMLTDSIESAVTQ